MITDKEAREAWSKIDKLINCLIINAYEKQPMSQKQHADQVGISESRLNKYRRELFSIEKLIENYALTISI